MSDAGALSRLVFRLPGVWQELALYDEDLLARQIAHLTRAKLGVADDRSLERARVRRHLRDAAEASREGGALSLFFADKIGTNTEMPLTLSVFQPREFRMSPSIGTSAENVLEVFEKSLEIVDPDALEGAERRSFRDGETLRTVSTSEELISEGDDYPIETLSINYWYPTPNSKRISLANFTTPLAKIKHTMLRFTDAIVGLSYFD